MKVKLRNNLDKPINLSFEKKYIVYSIEFSQSGDIYYRIENDSNKVVPYLSTLFDVVSNHTNSDWILWEKPNNGSASLPKQFADPMFWENYYNDDPKTLSLFNQVKERLYLEELEESEINEILDRGREEDITVIFNALIKAKSETFNPKIIQFAKSKLEESSFKEYDLLKLAFKYLSLFNNENVNDFFLYYLTNIELGTKELTEIVNEYFN